MWHRLDHRSRLGDTVQETPEVGRRSVWAEQHDINMVDVTKSSGLARMGGYGNVLLGRQVLGRKDTVLLNER